MKNLSLILLHIFIYFCIINLAECRTVRRDTDTELLTTSSAVINNCEVGAYESEFGAGFEVRETSNVSLLININMNHPSLVGESLALKLFKDNTNIDLIFPNNVNGNFPIEVQLNTENQNLYIVYEFGLVIVALRIISGQESNNGEYKIQVGTLNTPVLATATSAVEFITGCSADTVGVITSDSSDISYSEVGIYTKKFGGSVHMPSGSSLSLRIIFNELHPELGGETPIVSLFKDGVELSFLFGFVSEGEFPLEPGSVRDTYPNIFVRYDLGFVHNSLVIRNGSPVYNGMYTLTISTSTRFGIASATTQVWFEDSATAPVLKRSDRNVVVYNELTEYSGHIGDSFVVLSSTWNVIEITAEDTNDNRNIIWNWYFTPVGGNRQLVLPSDIIQIIISRNSSVLRILQGNQQCLGLYTVEASNSAGLDTGSVEINRLMVPTVTLQGESSASKGVIRIGEHVDISRLEGTDIIVIEARDQTGFPRTATNWFYSDCKDGVRERIESSEELEVVSMSGVSRLIVRNATKRGYGYYFAVSANLAGVDEVYSILGRTPEFEKRNIFHYVRGFTRGQISDAFKLSGNSLVSIEANAKGFPAVSFQWFQIDPLYLYTYEERMISNSYVTIGNTLNKSVLTQLRTPPINFIKYTVRANNELGEAKEYSYVISSRN